MHLHGCNPHIKIPVQYGMFAILSQHTNQFSPESSFSRLLLWPLTQSDFWWRYGAAAGQATDNAVNSAINMGITAFNVDNLGIKAVVKKTGKHTAQAILEDYKIQDRQQNGKQMEKADKK